ncbi:MAG: hypothetical protein L6R00_18820 [Phycisphaerae bacterium]|nr:hypothetical protein [Phycisphaerae bacterium]
MRQAYLTRAILLLLAASSGPWAMRTRRSSRRRRFERRIASRLPRGLVQRVAGQEDLCPENDCTYQYLNDATGNCVGVVCAGGGSVGGSCSSANLYAVRFSRMDAWGNLISPVYLDGLPPALLVDDVDCTASTAEGCDPADGMPQEEVLAGPYQYHGSDRYETDLIDMDKLLRPDGGQAAPGAGRSTGFVHVGVRYYEPATGRFLQHDPMFIDPTPFAWGQHNRWVYCANDPVNLSDPSGMWLPALLFAVGAVIGVWIAVEYGNAVLGLLQQILIGILTTLLSARVESLCEYQRMKLLTELGRALAELARIAPALAVFLQGLAAEGLFIAYTLGVPFIAGLITGFGLGMIFGRKRRRCRVRTFT